MQTIVGIFAHPDDEAFGPSGTLALLSKAKSVYLICVTNGDAATGVADEALGKIRQQELHASAKILGIKEVFFLNFLDGSLSNNQYHIIAEKIEEILKKLQPELLITIENRGVSGHLDHIAVSMISSFVFEKLSFVKEIWYHCIDEDMRAKFPPYFIYMPQGYKKEQIDKIIDVSAVWDKKIQAMSQHQSQIKDVDKIEKIEKESPKEEYFLIKKKS